MSATLEIRRTEDGWELKCLAACRDYHLSLEPLDELVWVLDEFDTDINNADAAHLGSTEHPTMAEALAEAFDRCEDIMKYQS